ncbi:PIN domain-like protein [Mrakia frigida]|uniref:multifunctional nuclease RAD27 n=1 Tax=Mrakia frigida TaxID=29902 RepID=UPI003FCC0D2C
MGIKGLTALIGEEAPKAMTEHDIKTMFGRKVAIDASMSLYQFLIAVRQKDGEMLMNDAGEVTSHLMGTFYRTIRMVDHGIKPCYVFDGKPPDMKKGVLNKRFEKREEAKAGEEEAKETGTVEEIDKMNRRQVRVTREQNLECQKLLKLMGIPVVVAPSEAEAQCAELARGGKVYGAGSEDMDTLTFNSPILLRHLTFSEAKKAPIAEINLARVLEGMNMEMDQFVDLCILMGCDYVEPIKGVGPSTAVKLIREHGSLKKVVKFLRQAQADREGAAEPSDSEEEEEVEEESEEEEEAQDSDVESEDGGAEEYDSDGELIVKEKAEGSSSPAKKAKKKAAPKKKKTAAKKGKGKKKGGIVVPEDWNWEGAKELFLHPDVTKAEDVEVEWSMPDVDGLIEFLVRDKGFSEDRVRAGASKLAKGFNAKQQGRLDSFFKVLPKDPSKEASSSKKKADEKKGGAKRKGGAKEKADAKKSKASGSKKK